MYGFDTKAKLQASLRKNQTAYLSRQVTSQNTYIILKQSEKRVYHSTMFLLTLTAESAW
jgi:hypothetical protein